MRCDPLNATINRYEAWNQGNCIQKQLLVRTAPVPLVTLIVGKIGQEFFVNFIWRCVLKTFINLGAIAIRVLVCKFQCKERLKEIANAPLNMIRTFGRILRLVECSLYALVAFFALKPALEQFKAAGIFRSKLEKERRDEKKEFAFQTGVHKGMWDQFHIDQAEIQGLNAGIVGFQEEIARREARILELEKALTDEAGIASKAIEGETGVANNAITGLRENLATAQAEKKKLEAEVERLKTEGLNLVQNVIEAKDKEIHELKSQIETLKAAPNTAEQPVIAKDEQVKDIEAKLKAVEAEAENLRNELDQSLQAKEKLVQTEEDLKAQLTQKEELIKRQAEQLISFENMVEAKDEKMEVLVEALDASQKDLTPPNPPSSPTNSSSSTDTSSTSTPSGISKNQKKKLKRQQSAQKP